MPLDLYQEPENKWIVFIRNHWSKLLMALLIAATILVWSERLFGKKVSHCREDFLTANQFFQRFQRGELIDLESLLSCEGIVKKHAELQSLDGILASCFFAQNDVTKGLLYANRALQRNESSLPPAYVQFGKASILIRESKLEEALEISKQLNVEEGSILEAFNLLRLAMLGEEESWSKLHSHSRFDLIAPLFQEGSVSLEALHPSPSITDHRA